MKLDPEDEEIVSQYNWWVDHRDNRSYYRGKVDGKLVYLHCFILGFPEGDVDHKNHDGLDNRRCNLRIVTRSQNNANSRAFRRKTSSRFKGVYFNKVSGKWMAYINKDGKRHYLGLHVEESQAALAYNVAALELYGELANLNEVVNA